MSDACYCDYDDAPATLYRQRTQKARKAHKCTECRRTIQPGENYLYIFGIWDGDASIFKNCSHCEELLSWAEAHIPCICWAHGDRVYDIGEAVREYESEAPGLRFGLWCRVVRINRAGGAIGNPFSGR